MSEHNFTIDAYTSKRLDSNLLSALNVNSVGDVVTAEAWTQLWELVISTVNSMDDTLQRVFNQEGGILVQVINDYERIVEDHTVIKAEHQVLKAKFDDALAGFEAFENASKELNAIYEDVKLRHEALENNFVHYGETPPTNPYIRLWVRPTNAHFSPGVGSSTWYGGEVFNDYSKNFAGANAYRITNFVRSADLTTLDVTLDSVEGLKKDYKVSIQLSSNYDHIGTISNIVGNVVTIKLTDGASLRITDSVGNLSGDSKLWVPEHPELGSDTIVGTYTHTVNENNKAIQDASFAGGRQNIAGGKRSFCGGGQKNFAGYGDFVAGENNKIRGLRCAGFGGANEIANQVEYSFIAGYGNFLASKNTFVGGNSNKVGFDVSNKSVGSNFVWGSANVLENGVYGVNAVFGDTNKVYADAGRNLVAGYKNHVYSGQSLIAGMEHTVKGGYHTTGGHFNTLYGTYHAVFGRYNNLGVNIPNTSDSSSCLVAGEHNQVWGVRHTVSGSHNEVCLEGHYPHKSYACFVTGDYNKIKNDGRWHFVAGTENVVTGAGLCLVQGRGNQVGSSSCFVVGEYNQVSVFPVPEGVLTQNNLVKGHSNNVCGSNNFVNGSNNRVGGWLDEEHTMTEHYSCCFLHGSTLRATSDNQAIFGSYNKPDPDASLIIANGDYGKQLQRNLFVVKKDGSARILAESTEPDAVVRYSQLCTMLEQVQNTAAIQAIQNQITTLQSQVRQLYNATGLLYPNTEDPEGENFGNLNG